MLTKLKSFYVLIFDSFCQSMIQFWQDAKMIGHGMAEATVDLGHFLFSHWIWMVGFLVYWVLCALVLHRAQRKSWLYPALQVQIWLAAPFIVYVGVFYGLLHGMMWLADKDYRKRTKEGKEPNDGMAMGAMFVSVFIGMHLVFIPIMKAQPPEPEDQKFTASNGLVCYAHVKQYNDSTPYIAHAHCEAERHLASVDPIVKPKH